MTNDRIQEYINRLRTQALNKQTAMIRDTLRRMEAELANPHAQEPTYYDDTDPCDPWSSRSGR